MKPILLFVLYNLLPAPSVLNEVISKSCNRTMLPLKAEAFVPFKKEIVKEMINKAFDKIEILRKEAEEAKKTSSTIQKLRIS